jgi:hypothetical protein
MPRRDTEEGLLYELLSVLVGELRRQACPKRHRFPGYGFKWDHKGQKVPDDHEREVMERIVQWRHAGYSWRQITLQLMRHRVRTGGGQIWSVDRVRRAYRAELMLRARRKREAGDTTNP